MPDCVLLFEFVWQITAMFAYFFYGQVMTPLAISGAAMIITGTIFLIGIKILRRKWKKKELEYGSEEEKQNLTDDLVGPKLAMNRVESDAIID